MLKHESAYMHKLLLVSQKRKFVWEFLWNPKLHAHFNFNHAEKSLHSKNCMNYGATNVQVHFYSLILVFNKDTEIACIIR